jgi:3alpha(or 20beta)-hydroxysteroid dehydrogenase
MQTLQQLKQLRGHVFIITGAATYDGQQQARAHIAAGARVVLTDHDADTGRALARALGARALYVAGDVRSEAGWWSVVRTTLDSFGRIDGVLNDGSIFDASAEEGERDQAGQPELLVRPCHPNCPDCRAINAIAA